jgi:hypothetical protein
MAMDQQTVMERLKELYREKNEHLEKFLEPVTPFEFYREIFRWVALNGRVILRTQRGTESR